MYHFIDKSDSVIFCKHVHYNTKNNIYKWNINVIIANVLNWILGIACSIRTEEKWNNTANKYLLIIK